ncbi:MAG: tRNA (adenosine(37)-N6)-threonylcarbamoyltransferase complex dimerization subunit type 1 TsaB [Gammaproteobacteria bacterium]|nr:tRNA (adenosine(37)-N6)-threonylcarbamoyltransferase complex dimerization subunit type 1 TsaB [Gammaproteobacteria bacterium]MBU1555623.1 tRNA (adenosine(37)-N6)-threonylcarbamoyltransferase complex dimerization subunit type 1 TsaB [Gammaproteobacteria bacterium]MBU2069895.1 tRNA (adenosine(37)-N6)-threonylcarbamoyltransferase complex dimerization subunit type 1 TsaB [Gammaproteobacteria bacterium]MBU2184823.1 tRNA (adenosine(37)-N6)-threonylcarbamoyltransferase complex dimerization subunit t
MTKLLALDTSTEACSVALQIGTDILTLDEVCPQQHSKRVLPMVQQLLSQAGLSLSQLDGLVFGRGPGSFTGVRIGVGVTQGLAFGADVPVYGVSTLAAMAQAAQRLHGATQVIAAIDARMAEVYIGSFALQNGLMQTVSAEIAIKPQDLSCFNLSGDVYAVGTGWQTYADLLLQKQLATIAADILYPSAQDMLTLALPALTAGQFIAAEQAEPVYVRDDVTWQKLPGR